MLAIAYEDKPDHQLNFQQPVHLPNYEFSKEIIRLPYLMLCLLMVTMHSYSCILQENASLIRISFTKMILKHVESIQFERNKKVFSVLCSDNMFGTFLNAYKVEILVTVISVYRLCILLKMFATSLASKKIDHVIAHSLNNFFSSSLLV